MKKISLFLFIMLWSPFALSEVNFIEDHKELKKFFYEEESSYLYFGYGVSPLSLMKSKIYFSANLFQVHWIKGIWDIEIFSAAYGKTLTREDEISSSHFIFRSIPKIKVFKNFSVGAVLGLEVVRFPDVKAQIFKDGLVTPLETFSSVGPIYGLAFSQMFKYKNKNLIKLNEIFYNQTYSVTESRDGWEFLYADQSLNDSEDKDPIKPGLVFMLELSFLF